jgi:hypothetical protein
MKCPNCGSPKIAYKVSRKKYWSHKGFTESNKEPRTDFNAKCSNCGWEGIIQ